MKNRQRQKDGFTLVETVVAMFILSIIAAAYVGLFTTSYGGTFSAGRKSEAIYSAQKDADEKFISGAANNAESIDIILTNTEDSSVGIYFHIGCITKFPGYVISSHACILLYN